MADGTQPKCRAVCLISGSGTNLQAIIENINNKSLNIDLISVISDNPWQKGSKEKKKALIPKSLTTRLLKIEKNLINQAEIQILDLDPDLIILAGYMKILIPTFVIFFPENPQHPPVPSSKI